MVKTLASAALVLAAIPSTLAFSNTSPFFFFSTADLNSNHEAGVQHSSRITSDVLRALGKCPSQTYIIVRQEGVSSADYLDALTTPRLGHYLSGKDVDINTVMNIQEAVGNVDVESISSHLHRECGAEYVQFDQGLSPPGKDDPPRVIGVPLGSPRGSDRAGKLGRFDSLLERLIASSGHHDYTVIYATTPPAKEEAEAMLQNEFGYEMENSYGESVQMELKRDTSSHERRQEQAQEGGLFERYQYLSPGLFMGFAAIIPLFLILLVGLRALSSLEVSYFAFSKEMGPTAQRKQ